MIKNKNLNKQWLTLFIICLSSALAITITYQLNKNKITKNQRQHTLRMVSEVMPLKYDNELLEDNIELPDADLSGPGGMTKVYRARSNNTPLGVVFMPVTGQGYNGRFELAVGVSFDGVLTGVRVYQHRETDGLGSGIEQNQSDWIYQFDGRSLDKKAMSAWAVKKDGGEFDQLSGATISSRAVITTVKDTLSYYRLNRDKLY